MDTRDIVRAFRLVSIVLYVIIIVITIILGGVALYLAIRDIASLAPFTSVSDVKILGALSAVFLVVIALEFVDMFLEYIRTGTVVVDLVLAVVLTAISRELLLYIASPGASFSYGVLLVASILVLALAYWLVSRAKITSHVG
ncbi:phosphate-starvation-inducible PsiE family protein [Vulcanisaeta sp. JCM 14467]|uniref:phosphate-starvation-inducible PsiE family protein n=1 Tax=Vulcanisaeta sp. JCM 14467 TaxID=1295370 RepID=UPI0006CF6DB7|nr:phosphate-starvation-inducible PsiE family protein [Vulcanisaeta sp. JCM 14467]